MGSVHLHRAVIALVVLARANPILDKNKTMISLRLIMTVRTRHLLTSDEKEIISQFIRDRIKVPDLRELLLKYRPELTTALGQQLKNTSKTWENVVDCPIDRFLLTLNDLLDDEKLPTESYKQDLGFYEYKRPQFYSLEIMLKPFECGFGCPLCPAPILS